MQTVRGNILRDAKTLDLALRNRALQHVFWQTIKTADNIEMLNLAWRVSKRLGTDSISAKLSNRISELIRLKFPKAAAAHLKALERNTYMPISTAA
jgi:hypothetical protein